MTQSPLGPFRFRPPSFKRLGPKELAESVDAHLPRIYDAHAALAATAITAPAAGAGFSVKSGTALTKNGVVTGVVTGLASIDHITVTLNSAGVPSNASVTARVTPAAAGSIDIYTSMPTSNVDNTPIFTTGLVTVFWWVSGTAISPT